MNLGFIELTNISILLWLLFIAIISFSGYKFHKTKKKIYVVIIIIMLIFGIFKPLKFNKSHNIEITKQSFNSSIQEEKEIIKSKDQRFYADKESRDLLKEQTKQDFNNRKE